MISARVCARVCWNIHAHAWHVTWYVVGWRYWLNVRTTKELMRRSYEEIRRNNFIGLTSEEEVIRFLSFLVCYVYVCVDDVHLEMILIILCWFINDVMQANRNDVITQSSWAHIILGNIKWIKVVITLEIVIFLRHP